jgi:spore germination protein
LDIYVVKPGDSLWSIGQAYGVDPAEIALINEWKTPNRLVVGQALVIPSKTRRYTVRPGDSIYSIARRYGVSVDDILALNPLPPPYILSIGQVLIIPAVSKKYGTIETNAYIEPRNPDQDLPIVRRTAPFLTYLSVFSYRVKADASLEPVNDSAVTEAAKQNRVAPMMVITNFAEGNFNPEISSAILTNRTLENKLFANVLNVAKQKGYRAINVDFERIYPQQRNLYNAFLERMTAFMHRNGLLVSTALAPKTSDIKTGEWHGGHDYAAHGRIVDFVIIMTYEWGWSGGPFLTIGIRKKRMIKALSAIESAFSHSSGYSFSWRNVPVNPA